MEHEGKQYTIESITEIKKILEDVKVQIEKCN